MPLFCYLTFGGVITGRHGHTALGMRQDNYWNDFWHLDEMALTPRATQARVETCKYVIGGMREAKQLGALVVSVACNCPLPIEESC